MSQAKRRSSSVLKGVALGCLSVVLLAGFALGLLVWFVGQKLDRAHHDVNLLCSEFREGAPSAGFEARARELELSFDRSEGHGVDQEPTHYWAQAGVFTSAWTCSVTAADGRVLSSEITQQD